MPNIKTTHNNNTSNFTTNAQKLIKSFNGDIICAQEHYSWGACDEMGPTEHYWSLYVIIIIDECIHNMQFYREVFEMQGDTNSSVEYESISQIEDDVFSHMWNSCIEESQNVNQYEESDIEEDIYNTSFSSMTTQAAAILATLSGEILGIYECYNNGDCDKYGPVEHMWSLYIILKQNDTISHHKFYREVFENHGDENENIEYELETIYDYDREIFEKMMKQNNISV